MGEKLQLHNILVFLNVNIQGKDPLSSTESNTYYTSYTPTPPFLLHLLKTPTFQAIFSTSRNAFRFSSGSILIL